MALTVEDIKAQLSGVALCHAGAPEKSHNKGFLGEYYSEKGLLYSYEAISPRETGLSAEALRAYFGSDMSRKCRKFNHQLFATDENEPPAPAFVPLYATAGMAGRFSPDCGIEASSKTASYSLIIRSEKREIVGFVEFSFELTGSHEWDDASEDPAEIPHLDLKVSLDFAYTCAGHRHQGVFTAAKTAIRRAYEAELENISAQLSPVVEEAEGAILLTTSLYAEWLSKSGKMATLLLELELGGVAEAEDYDADDFPNLRLGELRLDAGY